jgi:NAD-dependent dihydropyrimidine dehydrogenase PreA subunit
MSDFLYLSKDITLELKEERCTGCGMCLKVCPHAVFDLSARKAAIIRRDYCMECGACALNCPTDAIYVRSGVGCATGILNGILRNTEPSCDCSADGAACC